MSDLQAELNELRINIENMASHTEDEWRASGLEAVATMLRMWFLEAGPEMKQRARKAETALNEANKLLEQTIKLLGKFDDSWIDADSYAGWLWWDKGLKPLLDNLKAREKETQVTDDRDGFLIHDFTGREIHFVPCAYNDRMRERAEAGLLLKTDLGRFYVADTRDSWKESGREEVQNVPPKGVSS